jgi:hypothetical protein
VRVRCHLVAIDPGLLAASRRRLGGEENLPVTNAHVMRRTQITGDGSDHDPTLIDLDL